ncbi:MAG: DUF1559 domain-containing protein, partial [Gemmataceae bacterium]
QGLALHGYHDVNGRFPSALQHYHAPSTTTYTPNTYRAEPPPGGSRLSNIGWMFPNEGVFWSWTYRIAPYMEMSNEFKLATISTDYPMGWPWPGFSNGNWQAIMPLPAKIMQCPSDSRSNLIYEDTASGDATHKAALTSYFGVVGRDQFRETIAGSGNPSPSAKLAGQDGILYVNSSVKIVGITDGTSNTVMVGERPPSNTLLYGWMWAGSGDSPTFGTTDVVLGVRERGFTPNATPDFYRPGTIQDPSDQHRYHYWSFHPGGGMWLMGDGSVRFLTYTIASQNVATINGITVSLPEALASRAGGEVFSLE